MYVKRTQCSKKLKAMREAKERKRRRNGSQPRALALPELRRRIVITDYDFGEVTHQVDCYRSSRVDCYRVEVDGKAWKERIGWSNILATVRKGFIRVRSPYTQE